MNKAIYSLLNADETLIWKLHTIPIPLNDLELFPYFAVQSFVEKLPTYFNAFVFRQKAHLFGLSTAYKAFS